MLIPASAESDNEQLAALIGAADLNISHQFDVLTNKDWRVAATHRIEAPLKGARTFDNSRWTVVFAGDLVDHDTVPFRQIVAALETDNWDFLAGLSGIFAIAAHDGVSKKAFVISDRRSQKPLYYSTGQQGLHVSTSLAAFVRMLEQPQFNKAWLWQSLYFNIPIDDTTFITGVKRMPAASVLVFDSRSQEASISSYASPFKPREPLLRGQEALRHATEIFAKRMPAYYHGSQRVACALTAGWDGRTMLALAPAEKDVTAYTYGCPGCTDLVRAEATAQAVGVDHLQIPFEQPFVDELPHHALETVYLSGGLQNVLRSTLHNSYDVLTEGGQRFPLTISGIDVDGIFRGHAQSPDIVSPALEELFQGGGTNQPDESWRATIGADFDNFSTHIAGSLESLEERFGSFDSSAHHLLFAVYPMANNYFSGELAISEHFTTVRIPAWDPAIIELAFAIEQSMLSYSSFLPGHERGVRKEMVLQSHLFRELAPEFYRLPAGDTHPAAVLAGELPYRLDRIYRGVKRRIMSRSLSPYDPPLENWQAWFFDENRSFVDGLLRSSNTLVTDYLDPTFVDTTIAKRELRMLGKLLTTEIILRLIKTRWQRFW